jgi:hypothetical protein
MGELGIGPPDIGAADPVAEEPALPPQPAIATAAATGATASSTGQRRKLPLGLMRMDISFLPATC